MWLDVAAFDAIYKQECESCVFIPFVLVLRIRFAFTELSYCLALSVPLGFELVPALSVVLLLLLCGC